ncbi:MAG: PH domain-containing protein [Chloroflexota bacterium]
MEFKSRTTTVKSGLCLAITLIFLGVTWVLRQLFVAQSVSGPKFVYSLLILASLGIALYFAYYAYAYAQLRYRLDRNGLRIYWGLSTIQIPITTIQEVYPSSPALLPDRFILGIPIPGWWVGKREQTTFFASSLTTAVLIRTGNDDFVISPIGREQFVDAWQKRQSFGATQVWSQTYLAPFPFDLGLWADRLGQRLFVGGILFYLILIGTIFVQYPTLAATSPLSVFEQSTSSMSQSQILFLAVMATATFLINSGLGIFWHKQEAVASYLLWTVAIIVQLGIWLTIVVA